MRDYLIWAGEKYQAAHPDLSWDEVMTLFTTTDIGDTKEYCIDTYLKEGK